jgi:hypothetical protein
LLDTHESSNAPVDPKPPTVAKAVEVNTHRNQRGAGVGQQACRAAIAAAGADAAAGALCPLSLLLLLLLLLSVLLQLLVSPTSTEQAWQLEAHEAAQEHQQDCNKVAACHSTDLQGTGVCVSGGGGEGKGV